MKILIILFVCTLWAAGLQAVDAAAGAAPADGAETNETAMAEKPPDPEFARFLTILDRMPFGREPPGFNPDAPGTAVAGGAGGAAVDMEAVKSEEEQRIIAAVRVSVLNVTPSGKIAVGFTDSSKQPSANYYLKVGETRDGWTVESADPAAQTVKLSHDGVEAELKLGEGSAGGDAKGGAGGAPKNKLARQRAVGPLGRRPSAAGPSAQPGGAAESGGSALARLRERRQLAAAQQAERQAEERDRRMKEEEERKRERAQAAEERQQQMAQLQQIQEELARQREATRAARDEARQQEVGESAAEGGSADGTQE